MAYAEIVAALRVHLQNDDLQLLQLLAAAKEVAETKKLASSLELAYFVIAEKSADDVLKWVNLDGKVENVLTNPRLETYVNFITRNSINEHTYDELFAELAKHYDERELADILVKAAAGLIANSPWKLARHIRDAKVKAWSYGENKKSAEGVFLLLRLNEDIKGLLKSKGALDMWALHVQTNLEEDPAKLLFAKLKTLLQPADLANAIITAKQKQTTTIEGGLEFELVRQWLADGRTADDIRKLIKLDQVEDMDFNTAATKIINFFKDFKGSRYSNFVLNSEKAEVSATSGDVHAKLKPRSGNV